MPYLGPDGFQRAASWWYRQQLAMALARAAMMASAAVSSHAVQIRCASGAPNIILADRAEGAKANVQGSLPNVDPLGTDGIQQFRGKMQSPAVGAAALPSSLAYTSGTGSDPLAAVDVAAAAAFCRTHPAVSVQSLGIVLEVYILVPSAGSRLLWPSGAVAKAQLGASLQPVRRPGRARHSQVSPWAWRRAEPRTTAPEGTLTPIKRAGRTLEMLTTINTSPAFRYFGQVMEDAVSIVSILAVKHHQGGRCHAGRGLLGKSGFLGQVRPRNLSLTLFCFLFALTVGRAMLLLRHAGGDVSYSSSPCGTEVGFHQYIPF